LFETFDILEVSLRPTCGFHQKKR